MADTVNQKRIAGRTVVIVSAVVLVALVLAFVAYLFLRPLIANQEPVTHITTYEQCVAEPGSVLLETYPDQCVTVNGRTFTNPTQVAPTTP